MSCNNVDIPKYLHWNDKRRYLSHSFLFYHKLYRVKKSGNPIEIPANWATSISCRWSKLVRKKDVLRTPKILGDDYNFVFIKEVESYFRSWVNDDLNDEYHGLHSLKCVINHRPLECDYAHSEILIKHTITRHNFEKPIFEETYDYESWVNESALLKRKKNKFYKEIKRGFRVDMIQLICRTSSKTSLTRDFLELIKLVL